MRKSCGHIHCGRSWLRRISLAFGVHASLLGESGSGKVNVDTKSDEYFMGILSPETNDGGENAFP